jgi:hypothetical protein
MIEFRAGEAQRRSVEAVLTMIELERAVRAAGAEGSASDEAQPRAGEAQRRPVEAI